MVMNRKRFKRLRFVAVLSPYNCQRWDLNTNAKAEQPIAGIIRMIVTLP